MNKNVFNAHRPFNMIATNTLFKPLFYNFALTTNISQNSQENFDRLLHFTILGSVAAGYYERKFQLWVNYITNLDRNIFPDMYFVFRNKQIIILKIWHKNINYSATKRYHTKLPFCTVKQGRALHVCYVEFRIEPERGCQFRVEIETCCFHVKSDTCETKISETKRDTIVIKRCLSNRTTLSLRR